jgi:hypothetical protein
MGVDGMKEVMTEEQVTIGKFYRVPAVLVAEWHRFRGWLPVIGPMHEDSEIIGFPWQHFHCDWRFMPHKLFEGLSYPRGPEFVYSWPIQCPDGRGDRVILEGPTLKLMKCKRELPSFPRVAKDAWPEKLRTKYACARLINGHCPHRGIPVSAMRRDGDILECPGHGLRWNALTGEAA